MVLTLAHDVERGEWAADRGGGIALAARDVKTVADALDISMLV